jgi:hypothetical protein
MMGEAGQGLASDNRQKQRLRRAQDRYFATTSSAICGLTANTTASGLSSAGTSSADE